MCVMKRVYDLLKTTSVTVSMSFLPQPMQELISLKMKVKHKKINAVEKYNRKAYVNSFSQVLNHNRVRHTHTQTSPRAVATSPSCQARQ